MTSAPVRLLYVAIFTGCSALTLAGEHRLLYRAFTALSVPALPASALTGILNLSWHEFGYAIGRVWNSALVFTVLPYLGCGAGILSGVLVLTRSRHALASVIVNLGFGIVVAGAVVFLYRSHGYLLGRWRLANALAYLAANSAWLLVFLKGR
jgi:hypothetical protein